VTLRHLVSRPEVVANGWGEINVEISQLAILHLTAQKAPNYDSLGEPDSNNMAAIGTHHRPLTSKDEFCKPIVGFGSIPGIGTLWANQRRLKFEFAHGFFHL